MLVTPSFGFPWLPALLQPLHQVTDLLLFFDTCCVPFPFWQVSPSMSESTGLRLWSVCYCPLCLSLAPGFLMSLKVIVAHVKSFSRCFNIHLPSEYNQVVMIMVSIKIRVGGCLTFDIMTLFGRSADLTRRWMAAVKRIIDIYLVTIPPLVFANLWRNSQQWTSFWTHESSPAGFSGYLLACDISALFWWLAYVKWSHTWWGQATEQQDSLYSHSLCQGSSML